MSGSRRTAWERLTDRRAALKEAEADGIVADSLEVRAELIRRMEAGELKPEQMQAELARIKRGAKKVGLVTRNQIWRQS